MATRGRPGLSKLEKADLWERWKRGESLSETARALAKNPGTIHGVLRGKNGISPALRRRTAIALKPSDRGEISRRIAAGHDVREIAMAIGRTSPTVSRELRHNGSTAEYRAAQADTAAWERENGRQSIPFRISPVHLCRYDHTLDFKRQPSIPSSATVPARSSEIHRER